MKPIGNGYFFENFFGRILSPFERFLRRTTAGGIVLIITTIVSLVIANSVVGHRIYSAWEQPLKIELARWVLELTLHEWVNDGLMTLFFLLVGLELKRELIVGELSSIRDATLPIAAALGGMVVPAAIYWIINPAGPAARGWGVPMATDIAFAVGILVLLSWRIPPSLIIFLTALAIADDLGAVAVIALFYTGDVHVASLAGAAVVLVLLFILNRGGIGHALPYAVLGFILWLCLFRSGVHPTIAGILLAFTIPARSTFTPAQFATRIGQLKQQLGEETADPYACERAISCPQMVTVAINLEKASRAVQPPQQHLEHTISPWVTFVVLPVFAFSNLGIDFGKIEWQHAFNPVTVGVLLGLYPGKMIGITLFSLLAVKLKIGRLPKDVTWGQLVGVSWLGGIGFTMSLFIGNLAFMDPVFIQDVKIGILAASFFAGVTGLAWLYFGAPRPSALSDPVTLN